MWYVEVLGKTCNEEDWAFYDAIIYGQTLPRYTLHTSTKCPSIAAAAAINGLTRWVRP